MAKQTPSQQQVPSTESEAPSQFVGPFEITSPEIENQTSTGTALPEETRSRSDERGYTTHWGINE